MSEQEKKPTESESNSDTTGDAQRSDRGTREHKGRRRHARPNRPLEESVNMDELREIVELISEHGFTDFELENKEVRVRLRRELAPQIVSMPGTPSSQTEMQASGLGAGRHESVKTHTTEGSTPVPNVDAAVQSSQGEDEDLSMITSPIVGTFFRSPSPTADAFVGLGSQVNPDTVVCIIEAMKLMNEIQAETSGIVVKIYVENGQPVEYGQPLFGIKK